MKCFFFLGGSSPVTQGFTIGTTYRRSLGDCQIEVKPHQMTSQQHSTVTSLVPNSQVQLEMVPLMNEHWKESSTERLNQEVKIVIGDQTASFKNFDLSKSASFHSCQLSAAVSCQLEVEKNNLKVCDEMDNK